MISLISIRKVMGNCIKRKIFEARKYLMVLSSIGATLALLTSLPVKDGGPHDFRSKMAAPTTPRWRPPRNQDGGPCDAFGYTSEGESTP